MNHIFLCGHTGSLNRGCEAIVRSTVKVLQQKNGDITLMSFAPSQDEKMAKNLGINLSPYANYPNQILRCGCAIVKKVFRRHNCGQTIIQEPLFSRVAPDDVCFNIGGDTYCYGRPTVSYALNQFAFENQIPNILWCCSIEPNQMKGEMLKDLKKYRYIFVREQISYEALLSNGIPKERVVKGCDPAFFLDSVEVELPRNFICGNTVGINVSEVVAKSGDSKTYQNVVNVIRYILDKTDMSVCLIPHVYSIKENRCDYPILKQIYDEFSDERISIIDQEYTCEQLKFIISKCRFFIGARTHATIAAYSSFVPTLVIGYSVKSKGIAKDLFGTYEGYVLQYQTLESDDEILVAFLNLVAKEAEIRNHLLEVVPKYTAQLTSAIERYIRPILKANERDEFEICKRELCSGCGACSNICPFDCVKMESDEEGFEYPVVDYSACRHCGKCRYVCPVANKPLDDGISPIVYAVKHRDNEVRSNSSSGGAFTAIAERAIKQGGVVFGAGFSDDFKVLHKACFSIDALSELRGSKYVQSKISDVYEQANTFLKEGRKVLFTGTPCQIAGLYAYLGENDDNLTTMDFICHGVPSPEVWSRYLEEHESKTESRASSVSFRDKTLGWRNYSLKIHFDSNSSFCNPVGEDLFLKGFVANLYLRPSCSRCSFKQVHRQSDITVADFWGVDTVIPEFNDDKGISLVMLNTKKGAKVFNDILSTVDCCEVAFSAAIASNPLYGHSAAHHPCRDHFFERIHKLSISKNIERYLGKGLIPKIRRGLSKFW
ncbi:MAG: 4Fe-4S dicluster domain-containing protein [Ruminococcaceae bacterium]|nr:4Fe-4S dicluster domain-containing protein [Oscillospiraceae bacterium]